MIDIVEVSDGKDLGMLDSLVPKAANVLSIQLGNLEYSPDFGVDLVYFLGSEFQFQNESFKAYLVQRLTESQVNVAQVIETVETLLHKYTYYIGGNNSQSNGGLIL